MSPRLTGRGVNASIDREVGELRVGLLAVEEEMRVLRADVRDIRDAVVSVRGGSRLLAVLIAVSASLGGLAGRAIEFFASR
ncbi:MAG TPA: hypothetical protein VJS15_05755 [Allosphingosinicella sp.]|nr:hypothetical protein [Allosphingosinicella sp.]